MTRPYLIADEKIFPRFVSCTVTEERNGNYYLNAEIPMEDLKSNLDSETIIYSPVNPYETKPQPFRVRAFSVQNGIAKIEANHISRDLEYTILMPYEASTSLAAMSLMSTYALDCEFSFSSEEDTPMTGDFKIETPTSVYKALCDQDMSITTAFNGELSYDDLTVTFHASRGKNRGKTIRYGNSVNNFKVLDDSSDTYSGVLPYYTADDKTVKTISPVFIDDQESYDILPFDTSEYVTKPDDAEEGWTPTDDEMRQAAKTYLSKAKPNESSFSISFSGSKDYMEDGVEIYLCDTVRVFYGSTYRDCKLTKETYNALGNYYSELTFGTIDESLYEEITKEASETIHPEDDGSSEKLFQHEIEQTIKNQTELINSGLNGYVTFNEASDGTTSSISVVDNTSSPSSEILFDLGGIKLIKNQQTVTMWTISGTFNADTIYSGSINANYISGGTLALGGSGSGINIYSSGGSLVGSITKDGITFGSFSVDPNGNATAKDLNISGTLHVSAIESDSADDRFSGDDLLDGDIMAEGLINAGSISMTKGSSALSDTLIDAINTANALANTTISSDIKLGTLSLYGIAIKSTVTLGSLTVDGNAIGWRSATVCTDYTTETAGPTVIDEGVRYNQPGEYDDDMGFYYCYDEVYGRQVAYIDNPVAKTKTFWYLGV